ncbi:MAG TPA: hypothetical protein VFU02_18320 [Polyangiaceae bacterium]|nr:hypothetical protein [Polyangiaceae bacterium]
MTVAHVDFSSAPAVPQLQVRPVRTLVVFMPGMAVAEAGEYQSKLFDGIKTFADNRSIDFIPGTDEQPSRVRHLKLEEGPHRVEVGIVEAYWSDLRPRLSAETGVAKLIGGFSLLAYWLSSPRVWRRSFSSKFLLLNAVATVALVLAWYYGALATLLSAAGADPTAFASVGLADWAPKLEGWGQKMGGWRVWIAVSAITLLFPTLTVVDVTYASMAYLRNRDGFATKVKTRVEKVLYGALERDVDRVVIVAHSFAVAIAAELVAELGTKPKPRLSLVTLGGSLGLLRARSPRLERGYQRVIGGGLLASWVDFWSDQDWLGTPAIASLASSANTTFSSRQLDVTVSLKNKVSGASHGLYFTEPAVYEMLLAECGWQSAEAEAERAAEGARPET